MIKMIMGGLFLLALLNPVYMKYDYGAGLPLVLIGAVLLGLYALFSWRSKFELALIERFLLGFFLLIVVLQLHFGFIVNMALPEVMALSSAVIFYLFFGFKKGKWFDGFLGFVMVGALIAVLMGFYFYLYGPEPRMYGAFFNTLSHANKWPNAFALFLLMSWPLFLRLKGRGLPLLLCLVISALFLTYSRGALLVFLGQVVLLGLFSWKRIDRRVVVSGVLTLVLSLGLFFGANAVRGEIHDVIDVKERVTFAGGDEITSKQERIDFWAGSLELMKERPWFGYGPFSFRHAYNPIQRTFLGASDHPHNVFLKIGSEYGLFALSSFLLFVGVFLWKVWGLRSRSELVPVFVAIAGAGAHNLIDYNLNFVVNLMLLFGLMAGLRSVVVKGEQVRASFLKVLTVLMMVLAIFEGSLAADGDREASFYPRYDYLEAADGSLADGDFEEALAWLELQEHVNPMDSQVPYLRGAIYCKEDFVGMDLEKCEDGFSKALALNPQNEIGYYRDLVRAQLRRGGEINPEFLSEIVDLMHRYFGYVMYNRHFTAYTSNVEAASELIEIMAPLLDREVALKLGEKRARMLQHAQQLRAGKKF